MLNGYRLVACLSRLGTWNGIPATGKWVPEEEAERLVAMTIEIYCPRIGITSAVHPVHYVAPTADQMKENLGG